MTSRLLYTWDIGAGHPPDGSTGNLPAGQTTLKGSEAAPTHFVAKGDFSPTQDEHIQFGPVKVPEWVVTLDKAIVDWMANATSGAALWGCRVWSLTEGDADTVLEHAFAAEQTASEAANVTEARRLVQTPITITNGDSIAPGDNVMFLLTRKGSDSATDTLSVDAEAITFSIYGNDT